jgi:hypothetical protein
MNGFPGRQSQVQTPPRRYLFTGGPGVPVTRSTMTRKHTLPRDLGSFYQMINPPDPGVGYLFFDDVTDEFIVRAGTQLSGATLKP